MTPLMIWPTPAPSVKPGAKGLKPPAWKIAPTITQTMTRRVQPFQPTLNMRPEKDSGGRGRPPARASFSQKGSGPPTGSKVASVTLAGSWWSCGLGSAIPGPSEALPPCGGGRRAKTISLLWQVHGFARLGLSPLGLSPLGLSPLGFRPLGFSRLCRHPRSAGAGACCGHRRGGASKSRPGADRGWRCRWRRRPASP